jgi:hypothetical protein
MKWTLLAGLAVAMAAYVVAQNAPQVTTEGPNNSRWKEVPTRIHRMTTTPGLGVPILDGPHVPAEAASSDFATTNVDATVVIRSTTNWVAGTFKCGEATANAFGNSFSVPVYCQEGKVTKATAVNFVVDGQVYTHIIKSPKASHNAMRYFRLDGTNMVALTNSAVFQALPQ